MKIKIYSLIKLFWEDPKIQDKIQEIDKQKNQTKILEKQRKQERKANTKRRRIYSVITSAVTAITGAPMSPMALMALMGVNVAIGGNSGSAPKVRQLIWWILNDLINEQLLLIFETHNEDARQVEHVRINKLFMMEWF